MHYTHLHTHVPLTEGQTCEAWGSLKKQCFSEIREHSIEKEFLYFSSL
jgi:hypothetical protein